MLTEHLQGVSVDTKVVGPLREFGFNNFDGIVVSGRRVKPFSVELRRRILDYYRTLYQEAAIPVLGICFGAEVLAFSYGARLRRMPEGEFGPTPIRFHRTYPLCDGHRSLVVHQSHNMMIDSLPSCLENYASSNSCVNQALKHKSKPQFGVQFHPEMSENDTSLTNFVIQCGQHARL